MHVIAVLRKYQGTRSLREYSEMLGIGASTLSQIYSGIRRAGNDVHDGFLRRFPEAVGEYGEAQLADAIARPQDEPAAIRA